MSKVKFGVAVFNDSEDKIPARDHIKNIIKYLDSLDNVYESVWHPDHLIPDTLNPKSADYLESITTASYLMPQYPHLKFGHMVLCNNFRNPALLAKMSSTLQVLSQGRFIVGIGAGWYKEEYKQYGYKFPSPRTRVRQLEEAVQIIRMMWKEDGVTFHGKHYQIEDAYCNPKPDPHPPLLIAGFGEQYALKVVAKYADWWNTAFLSVNEWIHKKNVLESHCDDVGRDFDDILKTFTCGIALGDSFEDGLSLAKRSQFPERVFKIGTPESIVSQMGEMIDAGVEYFHLGFSQHRNIETTQLFADEVIPELI
jgi:alkanesulfonate monooxygenase SsuD/methylene tetrahydromethanopterin reductase-like flavin-dependent oxidoreductase (luciferase family)